jgi:hypothetical protein
LLSSRYSTIAIPPPSVASSQSLKKTLKRILPVDPLLEHVLPLLLQRVDALRE